MNWANIGAIADVAATIAVFVTLIYLSIQVRTGNKQTEMEAGEFAAAEVLYREDQIRHPGNGWSMLGLSQALAAQSQTEESLEYAAAAKTAWARVKERPSSSCLCAPVKN